MGKDSGMPDFRGADGFWNHYPPYRGKFNFYHCASPMFLHEHPRLFWGFYGHRLLMYRNTQPHAGFNILKEISQNKNHFVVTSNVDGHFQQTFSEDNIYEVHGSIHYLQCSSCSHFKSNDFKPKVDEELMSSQNLPECEKCGSIMRPNILMFDDWDWDSCRSDQQSLQYKKFLNGDGKMVILEIGSGTAVPTIRNIC